MRKLLMVLLIAHGMSLVGSAAVRHLRPVEVAEGESAVIGSESALEVKVGNPSFATASLRGNEISVLGVGLGETLLSLSDARGVFAEAKVLVRPAYWNVLGRLLDDDPEISIEIVGGKIVLSGATASAETLKRVSDATALDPARIISHVDFSPQALQVVVQDFIGRAGVTNVTVKVIGREVCLRGKVYDLASAKSLGERVQRFLADFPQITVNWEGLQVLRQKIIIGIEFVSWDDTRAKTLGITPPNKIGATATFDYGWTGSRNYDGTQTASIDHNGDDKTTFNRTESTGGEKPGETTEYKNDAGGGWAGKFMDSLNNARKSDFTMKSGLKFDDVKFTLNLAKQNRVARQTYATKLITQSGEEVLFQHGGTLYLKVQGSGAASTGDLRQFDYGYLITAKPVILDDNVLSLDFDMDYSQLANQSSARSSGDYELKRYKTKSKYMVKPGETFVLSGFDSLEEDSAKEGWPLLARLPLIGWLFGSRGSNNAKKEMLLVVTVDWAVEDSEAASKRLEELKGREIEADLP